MNRCIGDGQSDGKMNSQKGGLINGRTLNRDARTNLKNKC